jgi:hypothetical protein
MHDYQLEHSLHGSRSGIPTMWAGLQYSEASMHNSNPEWRVCQAICAFARKPTKSNLEAQLSAIEQIDPCVASSWMSWHCPWQVTVCLEAREAGHSRGEIIRNVSEGNLGAEGDWTRWELQNEKGLKLAHFRSAGDLTVSDELQGVILQISCWDMRAREARQLLEFADDLCERAHQLAGHQNPRTTRGYV